MSTHSHILVLRGLLHINTRIHTYTHTRIRTHAHAVEDTHTCAAEALAPQAPGFCKGAHTGATHLHHSSHPQGNLRTAQVPVMSSYLRAERSCNSASLTQLAREWEVLGTRVLTTPTVQPQGRGRVSPNLCAEVNRQDLQGGMTRTLSISPWCSPQALGTRLAWVSGPGVLSSLARAPRHVGGCPATGC